MITSKYILHDTYYTKFIFQNLVHQLIDSKNPHLATIPLESLENHHKIPWKEFPKFVTKIQLRYKQKNDESSLEETWFDSVEVTFNILQVAIITAKNHILEMLINHSANPATIEDYIVYVANPMTYSKGLVRSSISTANALHLAARFNPEALSMILNKEKLDSEEAKKNFWTKASEISGFTPLHNVCLNAVSTR